MDCIIFSLTTASFFMNVCNNMSFLFDKKCIVSVNSYDDKAATEKILQKLKLENFQVCSYGTIYESVFHTQIRNIKVRVSIMVILLVLFFFLVQLGTTKVFLRAGQIGVLDSKRAEVLDNAAKCIQRQLKTYITRRDFISVRAAAVSLQACCRG